MNECRGWLLDLYADEKDGVVLWFIGKKGERLRLHQPFAVIFSLAGPPKSLRAAWRWLREQPENPELGRSEGHDLFLAEPVTLLTVKVASAAAQPALFKRCAQVFPDLVYYDADVQLCLRHAVAYGTFPLADCSVAYDDNNLIHELHVLDSPWKVDPESAPLRCMTIEPDCDPQHNTPSTIQVTYNKNKWDFPVNPVKPLLIDIGAVLRHYDPDILITNWGDTWLFPMLLSESERSGIPIPLNRDSRQGILYHHEKSYFSYGQIVYKGQQIHLYGRCHIDRKNSFLFKDGDLEGVLESSRVTALPIQTSARTSPGTGISSMQMVTAMRNQILVPWHKQQVERQKSALDLLHTDQGGLVYQPIIGVHTDVAEIDFISMYPSVMVRCNISPEIPPPTFLGSNEEPGLIPLTLKPLLDKRVAIKLALGKMHSWDPRHKRYKAASAAYKWLLVTCFGYLGYKNARFGRIESHEAVTTWGREALLLAKEAAEDMGFTVLHMYVDGLWVKKEGIDRPEQITPLLDEISKRTGLSIALDGIYRWVTFLSSRMNTKVPVPNRYFGFYQDGSFKMRGIDARRHDMPAFIVDTQMGMFNILGRAETAAQIQALIPQALDLLRGRLNDLHAGRIPLDQLVMGQHLSRELAAYKTPSPAARALMQLQAAGKDKHPGQRVRFLYIRSGEGVFAWDLPQKPDPLTIDVAYYRKLLIRAAGTLLQPFGWNDGRIKEWLSGSLNTEFASYRQEGLTAQGRNMHKLVSPTHFPTA
jgi:DNA polymerase-2